MSELALPSVQGNLLHSLTLVKYFLSHSTVYIKLLLSLWGFLGNSQQYLKPSILSKRHHTPLMDRGLSTGPWSYSSTAQKILESMVQQKIWLSSDLLQVIHGHYLCHYIFFSGWFKNKNDKKHLRIICASPMSRALMTGPDWTRTDSKWVRA